MNFQDNVVITYVRHGNAVPPNEGDPDSARKLSAKGKLQAKARRATIIANGLWHVDLRLVSPTVRTRETDQLVAGDQMRAATVMEIPELFTPQGEDTESSRAREILDEMFERLKYSDVATYLNEPVLGRACLKEFCSKLWRTILEKVSETGAKRVRVVGHAVYGPCMAWLASGDKRFLTWKMEECGAFCLHLEKGEVAKAEFLQDVHNHEGLAIPA